MMPDEQLQSASRRLARQIAPGWSSPLQALLAGRDVPTGPPYEPDEQPVTPVLNQDRLSQAMTLLDERIDDSQLAYLVSMQFDSLGYRHMAQLIAARHLRRFPESEQRTELSNLIKDDWAVGMAGLSR